MPKFEIFKLDGTKQIDLASRLTKFLGSVRFNISQAGSIVNSSLAQGTPWYCCSPESDDLLNGSLLPTFTISGQTLSWTPNSSNQPSYATLVYGVYSNGQN